jgi:hypothetical protein
MAFSVIACSAAARGRQETHARDRRLTSGLSMTPRSPSYALRFMPAMRRKRNSRAAGPAEAVALAVGTTH